MSINTKEKRKKEAYLNWINTKVDEMKSRFIQTRNQVNSNMRQLKKETRTTSRKKLTEAYTDLKGRYEQC